MQCLPFLYDEKWMAFYLGCRWAAGYYLDQAGFWRAAWQAASTHTNGVIHSFAFSPTSDRLLYEVDQGGDDAPRLYLTDSTGKPGEELMPEFPKDSRIGFVRWAADGKTFLFITNLPGEDFVRIQEFDLATRKHRSLWQSLGRLSFSMASPDLRTLVLQETLSDANSNLYAIEIGQTKTVPAHAASRRG